MLSLYRFDKNIMALAPLMRARQEIAASSRDAAPNGAQDGSAPGSRTPDANGTKGNALPASASSVTPTMPLDVTSLRPLSLDLQCVRPKSSWRAALKQVLHTNRNARGDRKRYPGQVSDLSTVLLHVPGADIEVRHADLCVGLSSLSSDLVVTSAWDCLGL